MKTHTVVTVVLSTLLLAVAPVLAQAGINPAIQWSASVPGATFLYYDALDSVIWAAIPAQGTMVAISPTTHQVVASQPVGMQAAECDVDVAFNNLWCVGSLDRKSTRLNSSHLGISYAVFCLKKKKSNK